MTPPIQILYSGRTDADARAERSRRDGAAVPSSAGGNHRSRSLSLAAKSLNVSQPTLSRNIKSLEALIGAPVLRRGRYGVTPTHIGAALGREGRAIREALRQAELDLGRWKGGLEGRLRIGVGTMLAHSLVPRFLAQVATTRWRVALRIDVEGPDSLIDRVRARELDAAIVQNEPFFSKEGLTQITLFEESAPITPAPDTRWRRRSRSAEEISPRRRTSSSGRPVRTRQAAMSGSRKASARACKSSLPATYRLRCTCCRPATTSLPSRNSSWNTCATSGSSSALHIAAKCRAACCRSGTRKTWPASR